MTAPYSDLRSGFAAASSRMKRSTVISPATLASPVRLPLCSIMISCSITSSRAVSGRCRMMADRAVLMMASSGLSRFQGLLHGLRPIGHGGAGKEASNGLPSSRGHPSGGARASFLAGREEGARMPAQRLSNHLPHRGCRLQSGWSCRAITTVRRAHVT